MRIKSKHKFNCDREQVWDSLMDIDLLSSIISDRRGLKRIGKNHYQGNLPINAAPFKGKVSTRFKLVDINEPRKFRLILSGRGLGLDFKGEGEFRLKQDGTQTRVSYSGHMNFVNAIPGFVLGEIHSRLKMTLTKLFKKIEKQCRKEKNYAH